LNFTKVPHAKNTNNGVWKMARQMSFLRNLFLEQNASNVQAAKNGLKKMKVVITSPVGVGMNFVTNVEGNIQSVCAGNTSKQTSTKPRHTRKKKQKKYH